MYLTPRETEILTLCAKDCTQTQVGIRLGISPQTVKNILKKARQRLGVKTTTGAVYLALKHNLIV